MKLMVELDGQILPLAQCFWIHVAPNGCVCGSSHGDQALTADDAHKVFRARQRDRDREIRDGWAMRLVTREQWDQQAKPCLMGECEHRKEVAA
ncbi:hypothetical protein ACGFMM_01625 [Streptomyces sp. NPDC048604]|uniref:hypothetical protein n=1 Tax=Streptomyces sp. NPDC048604 TaxID=3365578 RepID=UPI003717D122